MWHKGSAPAQTASKGLTAVEFYKRYVEGTASIESLKPTDRTRGKNALQAFQAVATEQDKNALASKNEVTIIETLNVLHDRLIGRMIAAYQRKEATVPGALLRFDRLLLNSVSDKLSTLDKAYPGISKSFYLPLTHEQLAALPTRPDSARPKKKSKK